MIDQITISALCERYGISQAGLSRRFGIPLRTIEDWKAGRRKAPAYVVNMMAELLEQDLKK